MALSFGAIIWGGVKVRAVNLAAITPGAVRGHRRLTSAQRRGSSCTGRWLMTGLANPHGPPYLVYLFNCAFDENILSANHMAAVQGI